MMREWTISSGYFDFEMPTELRTNHAQQANKYAGVELRGKVLPADTDNVTKDVKRTTQEESTEWIKVELQQRGS